MISTTASGPAGRQKLQCGGTAEIRKRFCLSPMSSGIMKPWTRTSFRSRLRMSAANEGTIRPSFFTGSTFASVRHDTTPARSGSSCVPYSLAHGSPAGGSWWSRRLPDRRQRR